MSAQEASRDEHAALLADLRALATAERWGAVTSFLDRLASGSGGAILALLGQDVTAEPLLHTVTAVAGPPVVRPLVEAVAEPDRTLAADRVLVIFRCGQLLGLEEAEAARAILQRPSGSYRIVFVDADRLVDRNELERVQRAAWRVLLADPTEDWRGQDLAERSCLLWATQPGTGFLADRLERDMKLLRDWLDTPVAARPLATARIAQALDLAEDALAAKAPGAAHAPAQAVGDAQRAARLRVAAAAVARGIDSRLESAGRSLDAEITASLDMAREDLRAGVAAHLKAHCRNLGNRSAVDACLVDYLEAGMRRWHAGPYSLAVRRAEHAFADAGQRLEDVDWAAVDRLLPPRPSGHTYRAAATDALRFGAAVPTYRPDRPTLGAPPGRRDDNGVAYSIAGGAVGVTVAVLFHVPWVPTLAAGAAGALGGRLLNQFLHGTEVSEELARFAKHVVGVQIDAYRDRVRSALAAAFADRRAAVEGVFAELDRAFAVPSTVGPTDDTADKGSASSAKDRLAGLRLRLVHLAESNSREPLQD